jgi:hypothetical protein
VVEGNFLNSCYRLKGLRILEFIVDYIHKRNLDEDLDERDI